MFSSKTPWVILLALWMMGATWWHVCRIKQLCGEADPPTVTAAEVVPVPPLLITDGDRFRLELGGHFSFAKSGANANMNTLLGSLDALTAYLKSNGPAPGEVSLRRTGLSDRSSRPGTSMPGRMLAITGYYAPTETNPTALANLGLARAEGVKNYLVQQGIPATSLTTQGELRSELAFTPAGDSLYGGVEFAFAGRALPPGPATTAVVTPATPVTVAASATEESLAAGEKYTSVFEPIDLYFPLAGANYIRTPETTKFFDEATKYLAAHTDKKLLLTGHTDNSGPDAVNRRLARDRANSVKVRLRKSGIKQQQIVVDAKGETVPKAPNNTREGRKANRRVTVVVQ